MTILSGFKVDNRVQIFLRGDVCVMDELVFSLAF
jgi:hypothetical protein